MGPMDKVTVTVICVDSPWFLLKVTLIAQVFLILTGTDILPENPMAVWAEIVGQDRPLLECGLFNKGDKVYLPSVADTGLDVTIITH